MDVAYGGADLCVLVSGNILHEEIDEAALALQQGEDLDRAIIAVFSNNSSRRFVRCSRPRRQHPQSRRELAFEQNGEPCRKCERDPGPHAVDRLFHVLILT